MDHQTRLGGPDKRVPPIVVPGELVTIVAYRLVSKRITPWLELTTRPFIKKNEKLNQQ